MFAGIHLDSSMGLLINIRLCGINVATFDLIIWMLNYHGIEWPVVCLYISVYLFSKIKLFNYVGILYLSYTEILHADIASKCILYILTFE